MKHPGDPVELSAHPTQPPAYTQPPAQPGEVRCRWTANVAYLDRTTADGRRLLSGTVWTYRLPGPLVHRRIHVGHVTDVRRDRHPDPSMNLWVLRAGGTLLYGVHPRVLTLMRSGSLQAELSLGQTRSYVAGQPETHDRHDRPDVTRIFTAAEVIGVVASSKVGAWPDLPPLTFTLEEDCP